MTNEEFNIEVENSINRSKRVLEKKGREYEGRTDRLEQFHIAGALQRTNPVEALVNLASKHFIAVAAMAKDPTSYNLKDWNEKLGDIRNYTILADALLRDMGAE